jgi:hypothetical protein
MEKSKTMSTIRRRRNVGRQLLFFVVTSLMTKHLQISAYLEV